MKYPEAQSSGKARGYTEQFLGLDRRPRTYEGTFAAMGNMTGDPWPLMTTRKKRGLVAELDEPQGLLAMDKLAWVDGGTLYYNGTATAVTGLTAGQKQLVGMGAYIVVFPDGAYYNTVDNTDYGNINRKYGSTGDVTFSLADMDGVEYDMEEITVSDTEPSDPADGDYWINTAESTHTLNKYSDYYEKWIGVSSVYVKIGATDIGKGLSVQDGVKISGVTYSGDNEALKKQLEFLNESMVVMAADDDYIVVIGLIDQNYTQTTGSVRADREAPEMDYVIECNNRLWGCKYGVQDGEFYNILYASALGDMKNWQKFMGTAQDSYFVYVGTPGPFTGAAVHRGYPHFFKENSVVKVFGEKPSNFSTQVTLCEGVKPGSGNSLVSYNGALYYLSPVGVEYFESLPQLIGQALGDTVAEAGAAGECGGKYYLSARDETGWNLFVFDTERRIWHRQDGSRVMAFAELSGEMYMLLTNGSLYALNGTAGTKEAEDIYWYAETSAMGYDAPDNKYNGRFVIRAQAGEETACRISCQWDGYGAWEPLGVIQGEGIVRSHTFSFIPHRADSMKLRLEGTGDFALYSIAREIGQGSDAYRR